MDVAYDQITKESYPEDQTPDADSKQQQDPGSPQPATPGFQGELRDAYQSFQSSAWGASLGSFWGSVKQKGESYYEGAKRELADASNASRGLSELESSTQSLSLDKDESIASVSTADAKDATSAAAQVPESLSADIVKEAGVLFSQFRSEAASGLKTVQSEAGTRLSQVQIEAGKRLKQVQAAEDAADEALIRFGSNVRDYLRDAISISAPETDPNDGTIRSLLFESRDHEGRRMVHATRFDAQLHVVHTNPDSFIKDPDSPEYENWKQSFDVDKKTDAIAADLAKHEQLRRAMEQLVPEKVEYAAFWTRYYFMRHIIEEQEQKRRELLRAQQDQEEVGWDDDEEDDEEERQAPATPRAPSRTTGGAKAEGDSDLLKPGEGRRSMEHSVADSDASYDMVSANASRGPGSPRDSAEKKKESSIPTVTTSGPVSTKPEGGESDEEDWE